MSVVKKVFTTKNRERPLVQEAAPVVPNASNKQVDGEKSKNPKKVFTTTATTVKKTVTNAGSENKSESNDAPSEGANGKKKSKNKSKRSKAKKESITTDSNIKGDNKGVEDATSSQSQAQTITKPKLAVKDNKRVPMAKPKPKENTLEVEIEQLRIRFPDLTCTSTPKCTLLEFRMPIQDPDFPYDLPYALLRCVLPLGYPQQPEGHVQFDLLNEEVPPKYRKVVRERMNATARTFGVGELVIRPMLRYLEKNFEHFLTENAAVNRFKFFPPSTSSPSPNLLDSKEKVVAVKMEDKDDEEMKQVEKILEDFGITEKKTEFNMQEEFISFNDASSTNDVEGVEKFVSSDQFHPAQLIRLENDGSSSVRGDTFTLIVSGQKLQNVAHLFVTQIAFTIRCGRCQAHVAVKGLRPFVDRFEPCGKCSTRIPILYEPHLLLQNNNSFGTLRLGNKASFVDLLPCMVQISCFECSLEVQVSILTGEVLNSKFPKCFHAFQLGLGQCSVQSKAALLPAQRRKKTTSTFGISIGNPLPLNGACQHYTKSFRWYRFPCCNRAFPCDECHAAGTKDAPHEAEPGRKFLCGWCSREQNMGSKRCECGVDWSKGATPMRTAHWEGGKGMRDRTAMSRKDSHKYRGLTKQ